MQYRYSESDLNILFTQATIVPLDNIKVSFKEEKIMQSQHFEQSMSSEVTMVIFFTIKLLIIKSKFKKLQLKILVHTLFHIKKTMRFLFNHIIYIIYLFISIQ